MKSEVVVEGNVRILRPLEDVIDLSNIEEFRDALEANSRESGAGLILDLCQVSYIGSVGLGMISLVGIMLEKEGRGFAIAADREEVLRLFTISGLCKVLRIVGTVGEARRILERRTQ